MSDHQITSGTQPMRRLLRFSVRTLLLGMLIVCAALAWKVERVRKQWQAVAWIRQMGGSVEYDYERGVNGRRVSNSEPRGPEWLRSLLGIDYFADVVRIGLRRTEVDDVSPLAVLSSLEELKLGDTQVCDLTPLSGMTRLRTLWLDSTPIRDLSALSRLTNLEGLHLDDTQVCDLTPLSRMTRLKTLTLHSTPVRDVSPLSALTNLEMLELASTVVSDLSPLANLDNLQLLGLYAPRSTTYSRSRGLQVSDF